MKFDLKTPITDPYVKRDHYIVREGFVFTSWSDNPHVYDVIVIRYPNFAVGNTINYPESVHPLSSHIKLINDLRIEKATIISTDLSFIKKCPSLKKLSISPPKDFGNGYDYSPLYGLEGIESLNCSTEYGDHWDDFSTTMDYSTITGVKKLTACGKGHFNYPSIDTIEELFIARDKKHKTFFETTQSPVLKSVTLLQCGIKSLEGIENCNKLQHIVLWHNRSLEDISYLSDLSESLRSLSIESCPKIKDFSFLAKLKNLEHLDLRGSNVIPTLKFLENMKKLKTFTFSMEVTDGDLTPCLNIPWVYCEKGKKHYNLKNKDLPKIKPTEGFRLI